MRVCVLYTILAASIVRRHAFCMNSESIRASFRSDGLSYVLIYYGAISLSGFHNQYYLEKGLKDIMGYLYV